MFTIQSAINCNINPFMFLFSYHVVITAMSIDELKSNCEHQKYSTMSDEETGLLQCSIIGQV